MKTPKWPVDDPADSDLRMADTKPLGLVLSVVMVAAVVAMVTLGGPLPSSRPALAQPSAKTADKPAPGQAAPVSWSREVFPLLQKRCIACHSDLIQKGGLNMERPDALAKGGAKRGLAVRPGDAKASPLIYLSDGSTQPIMPPKGKRLTPEEIAVISRWVAQGAHYDGPAAVTLDQPEWTALSPGYSPVFAVAISPDGRRLALGRSNWVEIWDVDSATRLGRFDDARDFVQALVFSPDGRSLAVGEFEKVWLLDLSAADKPADGKSPLTLAAQLDGHTDRVTALAFTADGSRLVVASGLPAKSGLIDVWTLTPGKPPARGSTISAHSDAIYAVDVSADGAFVATASADKVARVFDLATGQLVRTYSGHGHHVLAVGFAADGQTLVTGSADKVIKLWKLDTGEKTKDSSGHGREITALAVRADGKGFYTSSGDKTVREWNPDGNPVRTLASMGDFVTALSLSADGHRLAAACQDGTVSVYSTAAAKPLRTITPRTPHTPPQGTKLEDFPNPGKPVARKPPVVHPPLKPATASTTTAKPVAGLPILKAGSPNWRYIALAEVKGQPWIEPQFEEKGWLKGKAPIGYGEDVFAEKGGTVTDITGQDIAFRHELTLDAKTLATIESLRLLVCSDNGAIVYINGKLVDSDEDDHEYAYWNRTVPLPANTLVAGRNVIAVHLINTPNSSDAVMDLQLEIIPKAP